MGDLYFRTVEISLPATTANDAYQATLEIHLTEYHASIEEIRLRADVTREALFPLVAETAGVNVR